MTSVATPTKIFGREAEILVDSLRVSGLRVTFKVSKSLSRAPNKAEIAIYNLTPAHRAQLASRRLVTVAIQAGYRGALSRLYFGQLSNAESKREGNDIVTRLSSEDGGHAMQTARVSASHGPGTPLSTVLEGAARALGVNPGNAVVQFANRALGGTMRNFSAGTTTHGNAARVLDRLTVPANLEWSIQDGVLQFLERGTALNTSEVVLRSDSGLVGAPSLSAQGVLKAKAFLIPDVVPGRVVQIEGEFVRGRYRVEKCEYTGDTKGDDWYVEFEGKAPRPSR